MVKRPREIGMPSTKSRALILRRAKEMGTNLTALSTALDKNPTYIQQYCWRESPRHLPREVRNALAKILHVDARDLDDENEKKSQNFSVSGLRDRAELPQYSDVDDIVPPDGGSSWQNMHATLSLGGAAFALWITQPRGRFRAEIVFVRTGQPPRVGDMVVVLRNQRVAAIGELCGLSHDEAKVNTSDIQSGSLVEAYQRSTIQLMKVAAAEFS